ncbi:MAG: NAD-dependent epimerase/dehydratase family protein [Victivallaceae bacterium]
MNDSAEQKSVLLTGATGFLGSRLLRRLLEKGYALTILKRSFSQTHRINDLMSSIQFFDLDKTELFEISRHVKAHYIIHCATDYGRKNVPVSDIIQANLVLPVSLLSLRDNFQCKCFINTDTIIDKRVSSYSKSKKQFREWLEYFSDQIVAVNVALEHFYGPGDDKSKFISSVINNLLRNADHIDFTAGEQQRDFIYIDDVVEAFLLIIKKAFSAEEGFYDYEIGTNRLISIKDVVQMMKNVTGNTATRLNFGVLPYRENELMLSAVNTEKIRASGWTPKYTIEAGILHTVNTEKVLMAKR